MTPFADLIAGAQFRADLQITTRVLQAEWISLVNEAIEAVWNLCSSARPDFQIASQDFVVVSGGSASFVVPALFHHEIDVVFGPDTPQEYSLGPFAWQNRRAPGGWWPPFVSGSTSGGTRARLMGSSIYIEPALRAGGTYRLWYCPNAHVCNIIVRLATTAALPACVAAGSGPGKTLTASGNGALSIDGKAVAAGDRVLVQNQVAAGDNGVYAVTAPGTAGTPFVLTRATDYDSTAEINVGDIAGATDGTINVNQFFTLATFTTIESAMTWAAGANMDPILDQFAELVKVKSAIVAIMRDEDEPRDWQAKEQQLVAQLDTYFANTRTSEPQKMIDTDAMGRGGYFGGGGNW